ncbi:MAG: nucleotidyltransferase family protein [Gemmatimonadota bacterium]|nr:nucleotidyltransferase family protein [Gemmatimonadota bacterium]
MSGGAIAVGASGIGCVVLAAGAGTRFGEPKWGAMLPSGERFLDAVLRLAGEAGMAPIVAVVPPAAELPAAVRRVVNSDASGEQIASTRLGLAQLLNSSALAAMLWPVDHPLVRVDSVLAVIDAFQRTRAPVVVPTFEGRRGHPTLFARECWRELLTVEEGGARAVIHANAPRVQEVPVNDAGVLRDIDARSDLPIADWRSSNALS